MLTAETESQLAKLFLTIIEFEREVELERKSLAMHRDFELRSLFSWVDRFGNGYLNSSDIGGYLREHGLSMTERELFELCNLYERNSDGKIYFPAFSRRILGTDKQRIYQSRSQISRELEELFLSYFQRELSSLRSLEISRRGLVNAFDFSLLSGFQVLDANKHGHISREALLAFMARHGYFIGNEDADRVLKRFDRDQDGVISYTEFVELVLPTEEKGTNIISSDTIVSPSRHIISSDNVVSPSRHVPESLKRAPYQPANISTSRETSPLRSSSPKRIDESFAKRNDESFDPRRNNESFDVSVSHRRSMESLNYSRSYNRRTSPLRENSPSRDGSPARESMPSRESLAARESLPVRESLPARIDFPDRLSLSRFSSRDLNANAGSCGKRSTSPLRENSPPRPSSPLRDDAPLRTSALRESSRLTQSQSTSKLQDLPRRYMATTATPKIDVNRSSYMRNSSPLRSDKDPDSPSKSVHWADSASKGVMRRSELSPNKPTIKKTKQPSVRKQNSEDYIKKLEYTPYQCEEARQFAIALNEQMTLDREFENYRQELALRNDFSIPNLFRHFDNQDHDFFSRRDMEKTINRLSIYPTGQQVAALWARFDKLGNNKARIEAFKEIWMSKEPLYAEMLKRRENGPQRKTAMSLETKALLTQALRKLIHIEETAELIRRRLLSRPNFEHNIIFRMLDISKKGRTDVNDVRSFLREHGIIPTEKDLTSLMQRYDRNGDGKISYDDFRQELTLYA